ncbi:DUF7848 domain-containing protein [Streptomyces sp. 4N509B]|uniref:DUF7848 domain-containing protein n=1 Tax=Streptomyces sp. 4N509B TaxID=3457413 RepID=UPI003FD1EC53
MTSGNVVLRGAEFALCAERRLDAPAATYVATCLLCRAASGVGEYDRKPAAVWSIEHTRRNGLAHSQFELTTRRHWRVDPVAGPAPPVRAEIPVRAHVPEPTARRHRRARPAVASASASWPVAVTAVAVALLLGCAWLLLGPHDVTGTGAGALWPRP